EIKHIQATANKTGMIRTEKTVEGIVFKGVGKDYNWQNIQEYIKKGTVPNIKNKRTDEVIISEYLANRLQLTLKDTCRTFFIKDNNQGYNIRSFVIVGIFNSGFQEFDANYMIGDI